MNQETVAEMARLEEEALQAVQKVREFATEHEIPLENIFGGKSAAEKAAEIDSAWDSSWDDSGC